MTSDPVVTVILTVFQRTEYLKEAIQSVLQQTMAAFELIVTDDADQAGTRAICGQFTADGRLRYRANPSPLGTPLNIAAALREARAKYICLLNDDDVCEPYLLERLVAPLELNPSVVLAFGNHQIVDAAGNLLAGKTSEMMRCRGRGGLKTGLLEQPFEFAVRGGVMAVMGCVFRKAAADPSWLVREVAGAYDFWLAVKLAQQGPFYFVAEDVMRWRQHDNSITSRVSPDKFAAEAFIYRTLAGTPLPAALAAYVRNELATSLFVRGREHLTQRWSTTIARQMLAESLKVRWRFHAFRYWLATFVPHQARQFSIKLWRKGRSWRQTMGILRPL